MSDAELEALIRARDALLPATLPAWTDDPVQDRRTLLRLLDEARNTSILAKAQAEGCANLLLDVQQTCIAVVKERDNARLQRDEETHQFQNFHRLLCERFGYGHDPVDWRRDQLSLIEHIAVRLTKADAEVERLRNIAMTVNGIISRDVVEYDDVRNAIEILGSAATSSET